MKLLLVSVAAATLALASPALAQDHHGRGHGDHNGANAQQATPATPAAHAHNGPVTTTAAPIVPPHQRVSPGTVPNQTANDFRKAVQDATVRNQRERQNKNANDRHDNNWRGSDQQGSAWNGNDRHDNGRRDNNWRGNDRRDNNWNRDNRHDNSNWRGDNNRHDNNWNNNYRRDNRGSWQNRFNRRNVTAQHHYRYRGNNWYWPHGYSYRRWAFGMTLPSLFWGSNYWINDYYYYGLGAPPPGTVWVRYGNDAILIDRYTGEILEVVYDQFY